MASEGRRHHGLVPIAGVDATHDEMLRKVREQAAINDARMEMALTNVEEVEKIRANDLVQQMKQEMGLLDPVDPTAVAPEKKRGDDSVSEFVQSKSDTVFPTHVGMIRPSDAKPQCRRVSAPFGPLHPGNEPRRPGEGHLRGVMMSDMLDRVYRIKIRGDMASLEDFEERLEELLTESEEDYGTRGSMKMTSSLSVEEDEDIPELDDEEDDE